MARLCGDPDLVGSHRPLRRQKVGASPGQRPDLVLGGSRVGRGDARRRRDLIRLCDRLRGDHDAWGPCRHARRPESVDLGRRHRIGDSDLGRSGWIDPGRPGSGDSGQSSGCSGRGDLHDCAGCETLRSARLCNRPVRAFPSSPGCDRPVLRGSPGSDRVVRGSTRR